MHWSGKL